MGNPVIHFEIQTADAAAAQQFYADLFDWRIQPMEGMDYAMVNTGDEDGRIAGGIGGSMSGTNMVTFYVQVDDVQKALDAATKLGGTPVQGPMDIPGGPTIALFADPQGNVVGLVK